jgi:hypothetical protein
MLAVQAIAPTIIWEIWPGADRPALGITRR